MIEKDTVVRHQSIALINHVVPLIIVFSLSVYFCVFIVGHEYSKINGEEESECSCCVCSEPTALFWVWLLCLIEGWQHRAAAIRRAH